MIHGQKGYLVWYPFGSGDACEDGACLNAVLDNDTVFNTTGRSCSQVNLIAKLDTLMEEKDPSGKKRLIYYHYNGGKDRTGAVTIGYLLRVHPEMSYCRALTYAEYLGRRSPPPQYCRRNGASVPCPAGAEPGSI